MLFRIALLACLSLVGGTGIASAGESGLAELFVPHPNAPASNLCMVRHYDKAHLAAHPNQNVTDMLTFIGKRQGEQDGYVYFDVDVQVKFRDSQKSWSFSGECGREAGKAGQIGCGIDCDGGGYDVSFKDDSSVELSIPSSVRLDAEQDGTAIETAGFKSGDTAFVLHRTALKDCLPAISDDDLKAKISQGLETQ
eukprot:gene5576-biopygen4714